MEPRDFKRERFPVNALIAASAVLCVVGALSQFLELDPAIDAMVEVILVAAFAALCGFSLWVANVAAACAQILAEHRKAKPFAFGIALVTAGLTGLVSVIGVDLAWMSLIGEQQAYPDSGYIIAAGFALAFVKVAMGFVIEACKLVSNADARSQDVLLETKDRRIRELETELRAALSQIEKLRPANDQAPAKGATARATASSSRATANALRDAPMTRVEKAPTEVREIVERGPLSEDAIRDILARMAAEGVIDRLKAEGKLVSLNQVRKFAEVPYSRVERSPGRHLIEALAAA